MVKSAMSKAYVGRLKRATTGSGKIEPNSEITFPVFLYE